MNLLHLLIAPALLLTCLAAVTLGLLAWMSRDVFAYARPFGLPESESLMNFSPLGSLQCNCLPTDPTVPGTDRRASCRACGNAIVSHDPNRLYEPLSRSEIRRITRNLRRAGIDAHRVNLPATVIDLAELHTSASLSGLAAR